MAENAINTGGNSPWGWLGLLKWSLAYSDGTKPTSFSPMSAEDKAFLEKVMKEGIIDENERMKEILKSVTEGLDEIIRQHNNIINDNKDDNDDNNDKEEMSTEELQDEIQDLLQELRDIVEQIDYARAFAAMKGFSFLLGCIAEDTVPSLRPIQLSCLGVLATMASNNPPLQKELLEMGAIKTLCEVFEKSAADFAFQAKIMQALSAMVRSYELSEQVFCGVEQSRHVLFAGLQVQQQQYQAQQDESRSSLAAQQALQKRTLFFLRALITSDDSTQERVRQFAHSIAYVADHLVLLDVRENGDNADVAANNGAAGAAEIREMALALLMQILEQQKSVNTILDRKNGLVAQGVQRVAALRALTGDEREFAAAELETWEALLVLLARATPDSDETPLMLTAPVPNPEVAPQ